MNFCLVFQKVSWALLAERRPAVLLALSGPCPSAGQASQPDTVIEASVHDGRGRDTETPASHDRVTKVSEV